MKLKSILLTTVTLGSFGMLATLNSNFTSANTNMRGQNVITQKKLTIDGVKVPKNTRLLVTGINSEKGVKYISFNFNRLSYKVRGGNYGHYTSAIKYHVSDYKLSSKKVYDKLPTYLTRGVKLGNLPKGAVSGEFSVTSNGYMERSKGDSLSSKPAAVKITKAKFKNGHYYLYSKDKLWGVNQVKVNSKGNYRYRLTITDKHKIYKTNKYDGNSITSVESVNSWAVGGQYFYYYAATQLS